jgi:hypothetical protein
MTDSAVTPMTAASAFDGTELMYLVQGGADRKGLISALKTYLKSIDLPTYIVNKWYPACLRGSVSAGGTTYATNAQYMTPFEIRDTVTIGALGLRTVVAGSSNVQLAIYASDPLQVDRPGALLGNTGNIANNGAAGFYSGALGANVQLTPGIYWAALQCNDTTMTAIIVGNSSEGISWLLGSATGGTAINTNGAQLTGVTVSSTFGTWSSDLHGATFTELTSARAPLLGLQPASVP